MYKAHSLHNIHNKQPQGRPPVLPLGASLSLVAPHGLALAIITAKLLDIVYEAWVPVQDVIPVLAALFGWLGGAAMTVALLMVGMANRRSGAVQHYFPMLNASGMFLAAMWVLGLLQAALMINESGGTSCAWQGGDGIVVCCWC